MWRSNANILTLCIATFLLASVVAWGVFDAMPHLEDEHANLFQAEVFAAGRATVGVPREPDSFFIPFVVNSGEGKRFGKYPPGYPLLLALGAAIGQPWLINSLAAALSILGVYLFGRDLFDRDTGLLAAALGAVSPMFVLLTGTLLAHTTSIAALMLFAWALVRARRPHEPSPVLFALGAGVLLGWAAIIRPWTALAVALPFGMLGLWDVACSRGQALRFYAMLELAAALVCTLQLVFNQAATGSPLTNTYRMWWSYDTVGFGPGHGREESGHTLAKGWRNLKLDMGELPGALFGWPILFKLPLTYVPIALGLLWPVAQCRSTNDERRTTNDDGRSDQPPSPIPHTPSPIPIQFSIREWALLLPAVVLIVAQMAYWARGSSLYGPRYYAEALPFLWLIAARGLIKFSSGLWRRRAVMLALPVLLAWSIVFTLEPRILDGIGLFDITRHDARTIAASEPHNALVFVRSDYWTSYAALSWLNAPALDGNIIFAKDRGEIENQRVIEDFPGRALYYYDRQQQPALRSFVFERSYGG
jgi:4-amino-4-deoxy-L-arabinose transferase-like glycosyltransferase